MERLLSVDKIGIGQNSINDSDMFKDLDFAPTDVPILNMALSGDIDKGVAAGITQLAAPSRHFKSLIALIMVKAYLDKHKDAVCIFYDSEFGITMDYIDSIGVDSSRVIHSPITNIEVLKHDFVAKLNEIKRGDKVIFLVDSIGNLPSLKEVDDADDAKSVADMTRAKALNSFWRLITTSLAMKDIPAIIINRSYDTQEFISKKVLAGGQGAMFSPNVVLFITKSQEKKGDVFVGWSFNMIIEKSRFVKDKEKFPLVVTYEDGINKWGGFTDLLVAHGSLTKINKDKYGIVDKTTGEVSAEGYTKKALENEEIMKPLIYDPDFKEFIRNRYQLSANNLISSSEEVVAEDVGQSKRKSKKSV